jgi:hypothetical protein
MLRRISRALFVCGAAALALAPVASGCGGGDDDGNKNNGNDGGGIVRDDSGNTLSKCATESKQAEVRPLDLLIGLDTSFSMDFDHKWTSVQAALKAFVANPTLNGLGMGLQYFPLRKQCSVADYSAPAVAIADLPGAATPLSQSLDGQQMFGGTPLVPMLEGLNQYMKTWTTAHPERKPVIVIATDGIPDDTCQGADNGAKPNTIDNAVAEAKASFEGSPSVGVFVIGVGTELTALNAIGQAGGTGNAILVDTSKDVEKAFLDALTSIRKTAIPCDYAIPALGSTPDPNKINVNYIAPSGNELFLYVGSALDCSKAEETGWYFDNATAPTKVILCPKTCDKVKSSDQGRIDVVFGCDRVSVK